MRKFSSRSKKAIFMVFWLMLLWDVQSMKFEEIKKSTKDNIEHHQNKQTQSEMKPRKRRQLIPIVFPYGGTYKMLIGFSMPVHNEENIPLIFAANFQYQYLQVQNISTVSQYYQYLTVSRSERASDVFHRQNERLVFYRAIERILSSKGFNGRECVLRAICEVAQYPVGEEGLVGELLHIILTPDYGRSRFARQDAAQLEYEEVMAEYLSAQTAGAQLFHCAAVYAGCPEGEGLMEIISQLRDE